MRALAKVGQRPTARALGVSDTKISRMKSDGEIAAIADFLTAIELKVVPIDARVIPEGMKPYRPESIAALMQLAKERLQELESPDQLAADED